MTLKVGHKNVMSFCFVLLRNLLLELSYYMRMPTGLVERPLAGVPANNSSCSPRFQAAWIARHVSESLGDGWWVQPLAVVTS